MNRREFLKMLGLLPLAVIGKPPVEASGVEKQALDDAPVDVPEIQGPDTFSVMKPCGDKVIWAGMGDIYIGDDEPPIRAPFSISWTAPANEWFRLHQD